MPTLYDVYNAYGNHDKVYQEILSELLNKEKENMTYIEVDGIDNDPKKFPKKDFSKKDKEKVSGAENDGPSNPGRELTAFNERYGNVSGANLVRQLARAGDDDKTPDRKLEWSEEEDPFNLLGVEDTYEIMVAKMFRACEYVTATWCNLKADARKAYWTGQRITFPKAEFSVMHTYELRRVDLEGSVIFSFRRAKDTSDKTGFDLIKQGNGHLILRSNGLTYSAEDEKYWKDIVKAKEFLETYLGKINYSIDVVYSAEIPSITRWKAPKQIKVPSKAKAAQRKFTRKAFYSPERDRNGYTTGNVKFSKGKALLAPLILTAAVVIPGAIDDHIVNFSEHDRETFDQRNLSLTNGVIETTGNEKVTEIPMRTVPQEIVSDAPSILTETDSVQNLKGVRVVNFEGDYGTLTPGQCERVYADMGEATGVKVVSDLVRGMTIDVTNDGGDNENIRQIELCNGTDGDIEAEMYDKRIFLEPVS